MINKKIKMAEVIHLDHHLLPVINRFGIQLGFGDKTVEEVCNDHNINPDFFTEIINAFHNKSYFPQKQLQRFSVYLIIDYLQKAHSFYVDVKLPEIENLIIRMLDESKLPKEIQMAIIKFFADYKKEFTTHINQEENTIFPFARQISDSYYHQKNIEDTYNKLQDYSIIDYRDEHDDIEEKLFDLKNIIIKYLPPQKDYNLCNHLLSELFDLEKDLNDHSRIEDLIMVPMIAEIEKQILERKEN
ncbi:MAG: hypothetical protein ACEPOW_09190 [Bacteroidales bacterium]